jgi:EmrB/QacA subfamily drug resistance transporter
VLDVTIVAVALPTLQRELDFSTSGLQWVVTAYTLCFAALLTVAGRAADLYGRRLVFVAGLSVFCAGSLGCGLAATADLLVAMRVVQGTGAAALSAAALALLTARFSRPGQREPAVAAWTAAAAGGGASGWVLGGLLTAGLGWQWVFLVNVPVCLVALAATARLVPESRDPTASRRLDVPGAAALALALAALVLGLTGVERDGMGSPSTLAALAAAVALLVLFGVRERTARAPLLPLAELRRGDFTAACAAAVFLTATTTPAVFLAVLLQQHVLGYSPAEAGLGSAPVNLAVIASSALGARLTRAVGATRVMAGGLLVVAGGALVLAAAGERSDYPQLLVAFTLIGAGLGSASVASTALGTAALTSARQGLASGVLGTAAQVGTVLGLAVFIPLAAGRAESAGGLASGYSFGQGAIAATAVATALALVGFARRVGLPATTVRASPDSS